MLVPSYTSAGKFPVPPYDSNSPNFVRGLMQDHSLLISSIFTHAMRNHPDSEVLSYLPEYPPSKGPILRMTYKEIGERVTRLTKACIRDFGLKGGDMVGTLAFNHYRHFECYYAVQGIGAILHTINPRLFPEQLEYIINHAEDSLIFVDVACVPILLNVIQMVHSKGRQLHCKRFVVLTSEEFMGANPLGGMCYETVLKKWAGDHSVIEWPKFDEDAAACLCYTSGTTGNPKGVLYSHRSTMIHALATCQRDILGVWSHDNILVIVPMFHVNGWAIPYTGFMQGARLILPGPYVDGATICHLVEKEKVTLSFGVPTIWLTVFQHLDAHPNTNMSTLQRLIIGGSACPKSMMERFAKMGVDVYHAWGMTETSPVGTSGVLKPKDAALPLDKKIELKQKAGRNVWMLEKRIVDENGKELPQDGKSAGELEIRGIWITKGYFRLDRNGKGTKDYSSQCNVEDGLWFKTGDVATIDHAGFIQITDRSKDVIKSGGEWISSIDVENEAMAHPSVAEAAVIGVKHPKWQERPLLIVVKKPGKEVTKKELLQFLQPKLATWWLPDSVEFVKELPHTATGKLSKLTLRKQFDNYEFSAEDEKLVEQLRKEYEKKTHQVSLKAKL